MELKKGLYQIHQEDYDRIWFTSDTHFGHKNILKYCPDSRPFGEDVDAHDDTIIENWNSVVGKDDIVFHLGDFSFYKDNEKVRSIIGRLNGKIYLCLGNHDTHNYNIYKELFEDVQYQYVLYAGHLNATVYLNHYPYLCYPGNLPVFSPNVSVWQLFGHVHSNKSSRENSIDELRLMSKMTDSQYDVGCDNNNLKPVSFGFIKDILKNEYKE